MIAETSAPLTQSQPQHTAPAQTQRLFAEPLLLEGEDAAAYDELLARICESVEPVDSIDRMLTGDIVSLQWEVLRWRRLKFSMIRNRALDQVAEFLRQELNLDFCREYIVNDLAEVLELNLPEEQANSALTLAQRYVGNDEDAVEEVEDILLGLDLDKILNGARDRKVHELMRGYARRESEAVSPIDQVLGGAGKTIHDLVAEALMRILGHVELIDQLTAIAESRRNAMLREIDRRRPILAETLRHTGQQIEHSAEKGERVDQ